MVIKMPDLTEEEYDVLEELWTKNPPKVKKAVVTLQKLSADEQARDMF